MAGQLTPCARSLDRADDELGARRAPKHEYIESHPTRDAASRSGILNLTARPKGEATMNPHGSCASCGWHSKLVESDSDGDTWVTWKCWKNPGEAAIRLRTTTAMEPPGCDEHYKGEPC